MRFLITLLAVIALAQPAIAASQGIVVIVADKPITTFDLEQRGKLLKAMRGSNLTKKQSLQSLIDDIVKTEEAKKIKAEPTDKMIDAQLERMAKGSNTSTSGLITKFKSQGISESALRKYVASQIAFNPSWARKAPSPTSIRLLSIRNMRRSRLSSIRSPTIHA